MVTRCRRERSQLPRSFRAAAMPASVTVPARLISAITGRTSSACRWACRARAEAPRAHPTAAPTSGRGEPRRTPRRFAAARAALVRAEIISRSCSATAARMWIVSLLAIGMSQATKSTPASRRAEMKATERDSRSSLAMIRRALCRRQAASAACSCGRSLRPPLSTSVNSATGWTPFRCASTAARCASSPRPDLPCLSVLTR